MGVLDLYRYGSPGTPRFSGCNGTSAYLSVDGGSTSIVAFNNNPSADLADFAPNGYVQSAVRSGLRQPDGIHMTADGHRRVAEQLAASIR